MCVWLTRPCTAACQLCIYTNIKGHLSEESGVIFVLLLFIVSFSITHANHTHVSVFGQHSILSLLQKHCSDVWMIKGYSQTLTHQDSFKGTYCIHFCSILSSLLKLVTYR